MRGKSTFVSVALLAVAGLFPLNAQAFCRTTTMPATDACVSKGAPLYWANSCVGYSLQRNGSRRFDFDTIANVVEEAFGAWNAAVCNGAVDGGTPMPAHGVSIHAGRLADVSCGVIGYNQAGPNQNMIVFRDDTWPHSENPYSLGLTTLSFDADTGEIFDADMEINASLSNLSVGDPVPQDKIDLLSLVTHEAGHFLGLSNSAVPEASLYFAGETGDTTHRVLATDDVAGICEIYRPDGQHSTAAGLVPGGSCDTTPRHGFSTECPPAPSAPATENGWSCSASRDGRGTGFGIGTVMMIACGLIARRRRAR